MLWGLLVGAGGTDKNELVCFPAEQADITFDIIGVERDPVHDGIEVMAIEQIRYSIFIMVHISLQQGSALRNRIFL
jgi:hypothetical protein